MNWFLKTIYLIMFLPVLLVSPAFCGCSYPELTGDFTLTAHVTEQNYNTHAKVDEYVLTISASKDRLLLMRNQLSISSGPRKLVKVITADKTRDWDGLRFATIRSGLHMEGFTHLPLFGVNLPYIPIIKNYVCSGMGSDETFSGKVNAYGWSVGEAQPAYVPGAVVCSRSGSLVVPQSYQMREYKVIFLTYRFLRPRPFEGIMLPMSTQIITYKSPSGSYDLKHLKAVPDTLITSTIISAKPTSLDEKAFNLASYLDNQTDVADSSVQPAVSFRYDSKKGPLSGQEHHQDMIDHALAAQNKQGLMQSRNNSGTSILFAILVGLAGWAFWRRRKAG